MSILIEVDGFTRFRVTQDADGKTSFLGTAKIKGATYFFTSNDLLLPDGIFGFYWDYGCIYNRPGLVYEQA